MMRRILVDYARQKKRVKRGADATHVILEDHLLVSREKSDELLALDDALQKLEQIDKRMSDVATLRFFADLSIEETAEALEVSTKTVTRRFARAWLQKELEAAVA